jgi:hypothetical protein
MSCPSSIQTKVGCPISRVLCEKWDSTNANTLGFLAFASRGLYRFQIPFCSRRSARGQGSKPMLTNESTPYNEAFPAGSKVRIADRDFLGNVQGRVEASPQAAARATDLRRSRSDRQGSCFLPRGDPSTSSWTSPASGSNRVCVPHRACPENSSSSRASRPPLAIFAVESS